METPNELKDALKEITRGGESVEPSETYDGDRWKLSDGTEIGYREESESGGDTIDIKSPAGKENASAEGLGKMNVPADSLEHLVLYLAEDDWLPIGNANAYAGDFEKDIPSRKSLLLEAIRSLAEVGYIKLGQLKRRDRDRRDALYWLEWAGTLDDQMTRLAEVYTPEVEDDKNWYYVCWLNLTDAGQQVVEALPEPDDRFFEEL